MSNLIHQFSHINNKKDDLISLFSIMWHVCPDIIDNIIYTVTKSVKFTINKYTSIRLSYFFFYSYFLVHPHNMHKRLVNAIALKLMRRILWNFAGLLISACRSSLVLGDLLRLFMENLNKKNGKSNCTTVNCNNYVKWNTKVKCNTNVKCNNFLT